MRRMVKQRNKNLSISNSIKSNIYSCHCKDCPHMSSIRTITRRHFRSTRNLQVFLIINEEGLLPQCIRCGLSQNNIYSEQNHQCFVSFEWKSY